MGGVVGGLERSSLCFSLLVSLIRLYYELNGPHKVAIYSCGDIIRYDSAGMNGSFTNHIQYYYCFHVISWKFRHHQVGLLNVDGFYDPLLSFIDLAVNEGFITEAARRIIISAPTAKELVMKLEVWPGPLLATLLLFIFSVPRVIWNCLLVHWLFSSIGIVFGQDYVPEYDIGLVWEEQKPNSLVPELESGITSSWWSISPSSLLRHI